MTGRTLKPTGVGEGGTNGEGETGEGETGEGGERKRVVEGTIKQTNE